MDIQFPGIVMLSTNEENTFSPMDFTVSGRMIFFASQVQNAFL